MAPTKPVTAPPGILQRLRGSWRDVVAGRVGDGTLSRDLHRIMTALVMVVKGFVENRGPMRAAALSYTTLLALIPLLAVMLSVSKNFLKETSADYVPRLLDYAIGMMAPQLEHLPLTDDQYGPPAPGQAQVSPQARERVVQKIQTFIDGIDAGKLGTIGTFFLVIVALELMTTIESTFNDIWGVREGRSVWRKVVYYWTTITLGPVLLMVAIYMTGKLEYTRQYGDILLAVPWVKRFLFHLAPFVLIWMGFTAMYALMPHTYVRPKAAFIGGIVGGTLWQLNSMLSAVYISRIVAYSKIYGSLGVIPVLLVGLYFSWLIILIGAQVSFVAQNFHAFMQRRAVERLDQKGREFVACRVMLVVADHFLSRRDAPSLEDLSERLGIPSDVLNLVIHRLHKGGLLAEVAVDECRVLPQRDPAMTRVADVLEVMRHDPEADEVAARDPEGQQLKAILAQFDHAEFEIGANKTFSELVQDQKKT